MLKTLSLIIVSTVITLACVLFVYNFVPANWLDLIKRTPKFGSTIVSIQGTDTISGSRTTINTNFANLNTDKIEATQTTLGSLTSAAVLATIGTITTGVWNATAIAVGYGGTGTTSPTSNLIPLGNGASGFKTVNGFGTSGQVLASNGAGVAPSWTSTSVDQTQNYTWTGIHSFNSAASTTVAKGFYANSIAAPYFNATSTTATSTFTSIFMTNATTTNIEIGGNCFGCIRGGYEIDYAGASFGSGAVSATAVANCSAGKVVIGGGATTTDPLTDIVDFLSAPSGNSAWSVTYKFSSASAGSIGASAICVYP